jgi:hypothetical protein
MAKPVGDAHGGDDLVEPSLIGLAARQQVASGIRCKSAGVAPGFGFRLGDGTDSFVVVGGLAGGDGSWPELAGWFEQRAAQVLQQPQAL